MRGILGHTLAHEITHSIKVWSEADYNVLTDFIRDALGADFDTLVKDKMNKLNMGYTMASDEVIADGCEMLLRDSKALEKLAMENANLFVKVASKVREFVANLRKAQTDMYGGNEELHDAALKLREALKSLEEVQEVFDNALENSIRNMRNALAEAENAKTRENLDVLEKQAEKEGLQLSEEYSDYDKPITVYDVEVLRSIGRKSINSFTSEDIQKAAKWAYKFYKELGYDAIILDEGGDLVDGKPVSRGLSIVVKDSSQIKSATDNIGTFDGANGDIYFSEETDSDSSAKTAAKLKKEIEKATRLPSAALFGIFT